MGTSTTISTPQGKEREGVTPLGKRADLNSYEHVCINLISVVVVYLHKCHLSCK